MIYCLNHPDQYIGGIYKGKNNLQTFRKICMICVSKHGIHPQQILTKDDFVKQLLRKSQQIYMETLLRQNFLKQNFKCQLSHLDKIQEEISLIIQTIKESILAIQVGEKQMDNKFLNLIKEDLNPFECSNSELDFLVNFLEGTNFEEWMKKKSFLSFQLQNIGGLFDRIVQNLYKACHLTENLELNFTQQLIEETIIPLQGLQKFDYQLKQTMFELKTLQNGDQIYQKDGEILRIEKNYMRYKNYEIIYNIEQQKHLKFKGQYGVKGNKIKLWKYFWKGKHVGGGFYNIMGEKEGNWVDLCENYWDKKNILEIGCYSKGKRIGGWTLNYNNLQIGGGSYDQEGNQKKIGKWVELFEGFAYYAKVTYKGEYNVNGMKVGRWDIMHSKHDEDEYKQIQILLIQNNIQSGGGLYDQEGNQKKIGKWVELDEGFNFWKQLAYDGKYNMNGVKVGRWDTKYCKIGEKDYKQIGGGSYDYQGREKKIGKWVELIERFYHPSKVIYNGEYNMNGMKVGKWDIMHCEPNEGEQKQIIYKVVEDYMIKKEIRKRLESGQNWIESFSIINKSLIMVKRIQRNNIQSGGGLYDQEGNEKKIGKWIELLKGFYDKEVTHDGEYNQNGVKIGRWDIKYCKDGEKDYKSIGGGSYDQEGSQEKIGMWVELFKGFNHTTQITYNGLYNTNGMKVGRWDICQVGGQQMQIL
ncbi:unnamed protein product [Paramecium sonneborni]|uniref:Uncharacterized protein n=1 Tax=Paramecium sonneborni TaxID=65129 RepID=A0A8S1RL09_9CILI|nr:unnamed protein product [Paramecium sonneborni]